MVPFPTKLTVSLLPLIALLALAARELLTLVFSLLQLFAFLFELSLFKRKAGLQSIYVHPERPNLLVGLFSCSSLVLFKTTLAFMHFGDILVPLGHVFVKLAKLTLLVFQSFFELRLLLL